MVEAIYSVIPSLPSIPYQVEVWIMSAVVFAMVFAPIWRLGNSLLDGWSRINAPKSVKRLERGVGYHNKPGRN